MARLADPKSGRVLTIEADQPGRAVLFAASTSTARSAAKAEARYPQNGGVCLETQAFPNAINVPAWRDQVILRAGPAYEHLMVHRFTTD